MPANALCWSTLDGALRQRQQTEDDCPMVLNDDEVMVAIQSVSLNFRDMGQLKGAYKRDVRANPLLIMYT